MSPPARPRARRAVALVLLALGALGVLVGGATPAAAHASLVAVDPPDGARLDQAPDAVVLTFSEPVSVDLGGVRVLDEDGDRVDAGAATVDGARVRVPLEADLADGTYVIAYRITSEDGHPVRGGSVFGVGPDAVDADALGRVADPDADRTWDVVGGLFRALAYGATLLAAGGAAYLARVAPDGPERPGSERLLRTAALVGIGASAMALPVRAALGTGRGAFALTEAGVLGEVAGEGVGLGVALAVVGLAGCAASLRRPRWALPAAAVAAASFATNGHTRSGSAAVATAADAVHLLALAAWVGGLVFLVRTLWVRHRHGAPIGDRAEVVLRFSGLATVAVLVVGVTGTVLSWNEVRSLDHLTTTTYGRLLLAKLAAVGVLVAAGAYNRFRLVPALRSGRTAAALTHLRTALQVELTAVVAVLAVTSVLVVTTPARAAGQGGPVERIIALDDVGTVQVVVTPARVGTNTFHLYLYGPDGRPANLAESVEVELALPEADLGPIRREATRAGPAHLQLDDATLPLAGDWTLSIRVRVDRFTEVTGSSELPVRR